MNWYLAVLQKYAVFSGRARRQEYWMFVLFNILAAIVVGLIGALIHVPALVLLYYVAVLLPSLAVAVRRLHDTERTGWWLLIAIIPLVGPIVLLVFMAIEGDQGDNSYGPDPKAAQLV